MKIYKIGIIGYGGFGKFLHHWWDKLDNVAVTAITDSANLLESNEKYQVYQNWEDLLKNDQIDIVSIATPPGFHAEMACAAMKAGKHVLLEKPVAITEESARSILDVQKETGRVITVNHMIRYNPIIKTFKDLSKSQVFGKLRHVVVNNYAQDASLPAEHWFWNEEISGGIFVEHGVHFFDIVNALHGRPFTEVYGTSTRRNDVQRDRVFAAVKYDDGLIASYYHAFSGPGVFEQTAISLVYDLARISIYGWMPMKGTVEALVNKETKDSLTALPNWKLTKSDKFLESEDDSRPEGWGDTEETVARDENKVFCGGIGYDISEMISGEFEIPKSKGEVYGKCVQDILSDMILKVEDETHQLTITLEDGFIALRTALLAAK